MTTVNDREWAFLAEQTGMSAPFNDMYFHYLRSLGYVGTLQDMIAASGLGFTPSRGTPPWVPAGSLAAYNALTNSYYRASTPFSRASVAWWAPSTTYVNAAVNELRRADDVGMILEPARTNINAIFENTSWTAAMDTTVSAGTTPGPVNGGVGKTISGFLGGTSYASINITQALAIGQIWTGSAFLRTSGANIGKNARLRMARGAGGAFEQSISQPLVITGSWQRFSISHTFIGNHTAIRLDVTGDSINTVSALEVYGTQVEMGSTVSTPIVTNGTALTRAADVFTFTPSTDIGTYNLRVLYDNDTEGTIASGLTGSYQINPLNLARPRIKLLWAEAV